MKLHLGCGDTYMDGYVNIDVRDDVRTDIVADVTNLDRWADGTIDEIVAFDLLEHFPASRTRTILTEWGRVLAAGGTLRVKVPNLEWLARALLTYDAKDNAAAVDMFIQNIYGGHRWGPDGAWDTHHTGWTPKTLTAELSLAGFHVASNDLAPNMTVEAKKL